MYVPVCRSESCEIQLRGFRAHVHRWFTAGAVTTSPVMVLVHGWMDMGASFQFVVDHIQGPWQVVALDMRGFGLSQWPVREYSANRSYWFADYLADLDALVDAVSPDRPVYLVGHSMGGNLVMLYAGVRPDRVCSVVNLEGFGMLDSAAEKAPKRYANWLNELKAPPQLKNYPDLPAVAKRLQKTNYRLSDDKAEFLANHWAEPYGEGYALRGDPAHKIMNPIGYRLAEAQACWANINVPVLHVEAAQTEAGLWLSTAGQPVDFDAFRERFNVVKNWRCRIVDKAGHMLHHDQPGEVARLIESHFAGELPHQSPSDYARQKIQAK